MKATADDDRMSQGTQQRRQDQPAETAASRLSASLLSAGDGLIVTDLEGRIEFMNSTAERLIGSPGSEVEGRQLLEVLRLEQRSGSGVTGNLVELAVVSETPVSLGRDLVLVSADGASREVEGEISARMTVGGATGTVVTFRDVTARNWDEARTRELQKMHAVSRLAGAVAHELNNLLTVLIGHSEALEDLQATNPAIRDTATAILAAGDGIAAITRRLLTLSGKRVLAPTAVDLNGLLRDLTPKIKGLLSPETELVIRLDATADTILADIEQMSEAVLDLVRLTAARMKEGAGRLEISTANIATDEGVRARHTRRYLQLMMTDTGPSLRGIATEELFEPSWVAGEGRPSGLGLFAVRTAISTAQGHLSIHSESERGADFVLHLPLAEEVGAVVAATAGASAQKPKTDSAASKNLLLVEDDHAIRILLRDSFEQRGYMVIEARDGAEALLQAELHGEQIDMVITDVVMPNMDGPALVRELLQSHPETKVLLTSGCPLEEKDVQDLVATGAQYMQKPFSRRELMSRVESILGSQS